MTQEEFLLEFSRIEYLPIPAGEKLALRLAAAYRRFETDVEETMKDGQK